MAGAVQACVPVRRSVLQPVYCVVHGYLWQTLATALLALKLGRETDFDAHLRNDTLSQNSCDAGSQCIVN